MKIGRKKSRENSAASWNVKKFLNQQFFTGIYLCERYKITSLTQANKLLQEEIVFYNEEHIHAETEEIPEKRWRKAIEEGRSVLRPIPEKTPKDIIFALHYPRSVKGDGTVSFGGQFWKVPGAPRYGKVTVVLRPPISHTPFTQIFVLYQGSTLAHFVLPKGKPPGWKKLSSISRKI
jgi:hypothetical protein